MRISGLVPFKIPIIAITFLMISVLLTSSWGQSVPSSLVQQKTRAACLFLESLYNPTLGLVRTTTSSNVYYAAPDNLLAQQAIRNCGDTVTSQAITSALRHALDQGNDGLHESLLGRNIQLPPTVVHDYTIANSTAGGLFNNVSPSTYGGNYTVVQEFHNSTMIVPDCTYADMAVYTALTLKIYSNTTGARHEIDCLNLMFDGFGLVDEAYKDGSTTQHGVYQTLNLALYMYSLQKISNTYYSSNLDTLLRMQGPDGGFHAGYDLAGTYAGTQENAETTAIAILTIPTTSSSQLLLPSIPSWIPFFILGWIVVAIVIVVLVLFVEKRKKTARYQNPAANPLMK